MDRVEIILKRLNMDETHQVYRFCAKLHYRYSLKLGTAQRRNRMRERYAAKQDALSEVSGRLN
jgi:hypothetical protein